MNADKFAGEIAPDRIATLKVVRALGGRITCHPAMAAAAAIAGHFAGCYQPRDRHESVYAIPSAAPMDSKRGCCMIIPKQFLEVAELYPSQRGYGHPDLFLESAQGRERSLARQNFAVPAGYAPWALDDYGFESGDCTELAYSLSIALRMVCYLIVLKAHEVDALFINGNHPGYSLTIDLR